MYTMFKLNVVNSKGINNYLGITPRRTLFLKLVVALAVSLVALLIGETVFDWFAFGEASVGNVVIFWLFALALPFAYWRVCASTIRLMYKELNHNMEFPPLPPIDKAKVREATIETYFRGVSKYPDVAAQMTLAFGRHYDIYNGIQHREAIDVQDFIDGSCQIFSTLPALYKYDKDGTSLVILLFESKYAYADFAQLSGFSKLREMANDLKEIRFKLHLPDDVRTEHHQVIGGSGQGKTTLFKTMIVEDLKNLDCCIIVMDSQEGRKGLIDTLAERVDPERLIIIDPGLYSPALNLFANIGGSEQEQGRALAMLSYIFSSKDVEFTGPQQMMYECMSRLVMNIPGGSLVTLRNLFIPNATNTTEYKRIIETLDEHTIEFFKAYNVEGNGRFAPSRDAIHTRLLQALKDKVFRDMVGAKTMKLDFLKEIELGKVILVNTNKDLMQGEGATLFGRIIAGLVMQAVRKRPELTGKVAYLYIDEFLDYASEGDLLLEMFRQGRKRRLGMIVSLLGLGDVPSKLRSVMSQSTSIKMAGGQYLAAEELPAVAKQLDMDPDELKKIGKGSFMANMRGYGTVLWKVQPDVLEALPKNPPHVMDALRERMKVEFGDGEMLATKPAPKAPPEPFEEAY